jgi:hypothetical protein
MTGATVRGNCQECGRAIALDRRGRVRMHGYKWSRFGERFQTANCCAGSYQLPDTPEGRAEFNRREDARQEERAE